MPSVVQLGIFYPYCTSLELGMAKTVTEAKLTTRSARAGLPEGVHYRSVDPDVHLSYRKGRRGGTWGVRLYLGSGLYRRERIATADDVIEEGNLTFDAAVKEARRLVTAWRREEAAKAAGPIPTVRRAVEKYIEVRDQRESRHQGREVRSSAAHKLVLHVLNDDELADTELHKLTDTALANWRSKLSGAHSSCQRITNDFKAALNKSAPKNNDEIKRVIKNGLAAPDNEDGEPDEGEVDIESKLITDAQRGLLLKALRDAGDEDVYRLCLVLAATGARFAQARLLKVKDVQIDNERIIMPSSRKGHTGKKRRDPVAIPVGSDVIEALRPIVVGRKRTDPLFERWRHIQVGPMEWKRDSRGPWKYAAELSRPIRAACTTVGLPDTVSSYSFRHSSIVRQLTEKFPVRLVAELHDTSIQMIERHYTVGMAQALEDMVRKAIVPMVVEDRGDNVVPMEAHRG